VLTAWIVGHTDRFRAAVVAKPVINWTSFVLTADFYPFFTGYWFPMLPWEPGGVEHYWNRSPLAHVGKVSTPTMLITGEDDYRTPISETEQYYQALQLRKIDTAMVRIPGASHGINARPSQMLAQVLNTIAWFERYGGDPGTGQGDAAAAAARGTD
jgi:acylaminoacyl-peptidase